MNKDEKKALFKFLGIYIFSSIVLMSIIAILYYQKESFSIKDQCSVKMYNQALILEQKLLKNENLKILISNNSQFNIGFYDGDGKVIYTNLNSKKVFLSKRSYINNSHEYHIHKLDTAISKVRYIVIEGNQISEDMKNLRINIISILISSSIFISIIGYFLSKLLINPLKSKMEKLNCFIKDSAHDINTPLSALMMSVSALKKEVSTNKRIINHISISSKLISQIYNSLSFIAFNDKDIVINEKVDLKTLINDSIKFFDEIAKNKSNLIINDMISTIILIDRSHIQKVINNIISNAIKYSYSKTDILILLKDNILTIEDKGIGIAKKDYDIIFNRYERKTNSEGGFGIGLDIVKSVCDNYDIDIKIDSEIGLGTTFSLDFSKIVVS